MINQMTHGVCASLVLVLLIASSSVPSSCVAATTYQPIEPFLQSDVHAQIQTLKSSAINNSPTQANLAPSHLDRPSTVVLAVLSVLLFMSIRLSKYQGKT